MHRTLYTLLFCLLGASVAHAQEHSPGRGDETVIRARLEQNEMFRVRNLDSAATFWTEDIVVLAGLGARVDGRTALRAAFEKDSSILYRRTPEGVSVSTGWPLAFERGRWVGQLRSDTSVVLITGWYSARWLRVGTRWRIQAEQFVADSCHPVACSWPLVIRSAAP